MNKLSLSLRLMKRSLAKQDNLDTKQQQQSVQAARCTCIETPKHMSSKNVQCKQENAAYVLCVTLCYKGRTTAGIAACNHAGLKPAVMSELALKYENSKSMHSYLDLLLLCATDVISSSPRLCAIV